jgi:hypothetical protein
MNFRNILKNPRTMMRVAMAFMLLFFVWPRFIHLTFGLNPDWIDGLRGVLLGVSMGFLILVVRRKGHGRYGDEGRT